MGRHIKILGVCALFLLIASLPASAGTICNFSNVALTGNSGSTASGSFSFDPNTHVFSNITISFNGGAFGGVHANDSQAQGYCAQGLCKVTWWTIVQGNLIRDTLVFNTVTGQFQDYGKISNWKNHGGFDYMEVPEGGAELTYLMLSGFAVFGGILISGKQRRTTRSSQSN
jgi:hypothetical protein